jgi:hypothetical protein
VDLTLIPAAGNTHIHSLQEDLPSEPLNAGTFIISYAKQITFCHDTQLLADAGRRLLLAHSPLIDRVPSSQAMVIQTRNKIAIAEADL